MLDDARLKGSSRARAVRDQLSRAGGLKLTAPAGTVPQAAIRRRHKPSLPRVSMERSSEARRQDVVEENQQIGAGRDRSQGTRQRVLTKVDRLYQDGAIDRDQWNAAGHLRNWIMLEWGASEGCSSYGEPRGSADRYGKADRHAARILRNDTSRRRLADAVFATCGLFDQDGTRIIDVAEAKVLIEAIARTTNPPTLTAIGEQLTSYRGSKQSPAAGGTVIQRLLARLAAHLGFRKLERFTESKAGSLAKDAASAVA